MQVNSAFDQAIRLMNVPSLVHQLRAEEVPADLEDLLRVLAGEADFSEKLAEDTGRTRQVLYEAAETYVFQVILEPNASHYRVLGAERGAGREKLRRHMGLLMRWLHPDHGASDQNDIFFKRVLVAWQVLQTPGQREDYDRTLQTSPVSGSNGRALAAYAPRHPAARPTYARPKGGSRAFPPRQSWYARIMPRHTWLRRSVVTLALACLMWGAVEYVIPQEWLPEWEWLSDLMQ